jgi:hypothetical protein
MLSMCGQGRLKVLTHFVSTLKLSEKHNEKLSIYLEH